MDKNVKLGVGVSVFKQPATTTAKPATKPAVSAAPAKAPASSDKAVLEKNLKDAAKITTTLCEVMKKKILMHKNASMPEATDVGGFKKEDLMKLVELLDAMGTATYNTACALRDLNSKMK